MVNTKMFDLYAAIICQCSPTKRHLETEMIVTETDLIG